MWTVSVMEQKYEELMKDSFQEQKKAGPPKENIPVNKKEILMKRRTERPSSLTLCTAKAKEHHPELEISVLAREVPSSSVFQDNRLSILTG